MKTSTIIQILTVICLWGLIANVWQLQSVNIAHAQTNTDAKLIPGSAGILTWCSFGTPPPVREDAWAGIDAGMHGPSDHCTFAYKLTRDHLVGAPTGVTVHLFQNGQGPGTWMYGSVACAIGLVQHAQPGQTDIPIWREGTWANINYATTRISGQPLSMVLPMPTFAAYPSGHQPTWDAGAMTVRCDVGNDFIITDVQWTEAGTD